MARGDRERNEAARARLAAAGITPPKRGGPGRNLVIGGIVLVLAVATGIYVAWQHYAASSEPNYLVTRNGVVVAAGNQAAPVTVDVYEDYLCPSCKQFEQVYGAEVTNALNAGKIKVNYHHIAILDKATTPPGYSTRAGGAALCAADARIFPAYHSRLYTDQPAERSAGKSVEELTALGRELGAQGDFAGCVARQADSRAIEAATEAAAKTPAVAPGGRFGTPTVLVNGTKADLSNRDWLSSIT